jgi:bacterial/archaeal transporter family protein
MRWLPLALTCAVFLALADFFVKLASNKISASLGMFVYGITTFLVAVAWVLYERLTGKALFTSAPGWWASVGVGLAFSGVTILLYLTFARVNVSIGSPVIRIVGIILASLLGILLLRESVTWRYALGVVLAIAGVVLIIFR